jgi:hypothetical protein
VGYEKSVEGRTHINMAEIRNEKGLILARSTGTFVAINATKMFSEFIDS